VRTISEKLQMKPVTADFSLWYCFGQGFLYYKIAVHIRCYGFVTI